MQSATTWLLSLCRSDGLFADMTKSALQLPLHEQPVTALALATLLLAFAKGDSACRSRIVAPDAVQLMAKLLTVTSTFAAFNTQ